MIFLTFSPNTDCGYSIRRGSNEYPLSMLLSSKTKGSECPCRLHCLYVRTSVRPYVRPEKFALHITLKRVVLRIETSQICCLGYEDAHLHIFNT